MTTYYNQEEIRIAMKGLAKNCLKDCLRDNKPSDDFINLIKHNFLAKFVYYNKLNRSVEIGVEESSVSSTYPEIKVFVYNLTSGIDWLDKSFKTGKTNLEFYGKLLNRKSNLLKNAEVKII
jgi:hypothetical protein